MFKKLLVPLDRSLLAETALGTAAGIARESSAEVEVVLVHKPVPFVGFADAPWHAHQLKDEERYLASIAEGLGNGCIPTTYAVLRGDVVEMICERAKEIDADLVIITSHGRTGLSRVWLGSVADGLVRRSAIPVLMLRAVEAKVDRFATLHRFQKILVPLDGSALAMKILSAASSLAHPHAGQLVLLRIVQPVPLMTPEVGVPLAYPPPIPDATATQRLVREAEKQLADAASILKEQGITDVETEIVVAAHVAHGIIEFARNHDVSAIAMSTHGRGVSRLLIGSVADKVLRASGLPMLLQCPIAATAQPELVDSASDAQIPALSNA